MRVQLMCPPRPAAPDGTGASISGMQDTNWLVDPARRVQGTGNLGEVTPDDRTVLRGLGGRLAELATLRVQEATAANWRALNGLRSVKPMVWIDEVPWHEMDVDGQLRLESTSEWARYHEQEIRRLIYQWDHMPADMVLEPAVYSPLVVHNTAFGLTEDVEVAITDAASSIVSRHFNVQIRDEDDLEKIKIPVVSHDQAASQDQYRQLAEVMDGVIDVKYRGANGFCFWFAPWDEMVRWWGPQELLRDLVDRPELVHHAIDKLTDAYLAMLDQFEALELLTLNNTYYRIGSGGLGYTDELPPADFDPLHVRAKDLWGCAAAQIFAVTSPRMHWEFATQYEFRWMSRFGLNYYGCCDPLHRKMSVLERIPRLRKVSMNYAVNVDEAVANVGSRWVFSYKPNPAVFAEDRWDVGKARDELETVLAKAKVHGCVIEVIMKDISTVRYQPQRLWEWARMAAEVTAEYAP
ncbi:MAG TPA: hypothetical protein VED59_02215 [Acidimicrobiales bacterium]|nr:hypothetical protein [Acidimicrobiales bacterium]